MYTYLWNTYLDKLHDWYRVEEVESSKPVLSVSHTGYLSDGQRGGIRHNKDGRSKNIKYNSAHYVQVGIVS